jgi:hypothetical protein
MTAIAIKGVRAGVKVRARAPVVEQPWQISSKHTMMRWLLGARTDRAQIERDLMEMTTTDDSDATDD